MKIAQMYLTVTVIRDIDTKKIKDSIKSVLSYIIHLKKEDIDNNKGIFAHPPEKVE